MPTVVSRHQAVPAEIKDWLGTVPGFLQGLTTVDGQSTSLYEYQLALMHDPSRFRAVVKSRQTGLSFYYAAEALALAHLKPEHTAIFVSYNLDDAKEKIRHAALLYQTIPNSYRKKLVTDNKTELEFENAAGQRSRLVSMPCREPRGKGKADVYLDELPFMLNSRRIYVAALPIISRGGGCLTLGSTPLSKGDLFYEVMHPEPGMYQQFSRYTIPWWVCPEFCHDVELAREQAEAVSTAERILRFATPSLQGIFDSIDLESFQQEYECLFQDDRVAFLPMELILANTRPDLPVASTVEDFLNAGTTEGGPLYAGYDVGRKRHASELLVVERVGERFYLRVMQTLDRTDFSVQRANLQRLLEQRPDVKRLCIDVSGLGMQLGEELQRQFRARVESLTFTNPIKSDLAHGLKIVLEDRNLALPAHRDLIAQLHSVRRTVTPAGNVRLDTEHDDKHHADKFWALALSLHAAERKIIPDVAVGGEARESTWR